MKYAIAGRIVTMKGNDPPIDGVVYVQDRVIADVRERASPAPSGFEHVRVLSSHGTVFPGLIDLHNHVSYNILPLRQVDKRYTNRNQWAGTPYYRAHVTGPMRVLGASPDLLLSLAC